jgi:hypothetical protein
VFIFISLVCRRPFDYYIAYIYGYDIWKFDIGLLIVDELVGSYAIIGYRVGH